MMSLAGLLTLTAVVGLLSWRCDGNTPLAPLRTPTMAEANLAGVPDSVQTLYREDAAVLAARILAARGSLTPRLNTDLCESLFQALMHVFQARQLPERDTVATLYRIHAWPEPTTHDLLVTFAPEAPWAEAWSQGTALSGHAEMDEMVNRYGFSVSVYYTWTPDNAARLHTAEPWNLFGVALDMAQVDGVKSAQPSQPPGWGNDIIAYAGPTSWRLYYQRQVDGAVSRTWGFLVSVDGQVVSLRGRAPN